MILTASRTAGAFLVLILLSGAASAYNQEEADMNTEELKKYRFETVTTKEGLKFNIPSDMPIERKDGFVQPVPFEEYLYIKFKQIEDRIKKLEDRQDKMQEKLMTEFRQLKEMIAELKPKNDPSQPALQAQPSSQTAS